MKSFQQKVASGALWVTLGSVAQQFVNFAVFIYLAQSLPPVTFGIMALAMVFVETLLVFGRLGQIDWLIHRTKLTAREASVSFWLLALSGIVCGLALIAVAAPAAAWFDAPDLALIIVLLSPLCLISNLSAVQEARLRRDFNFKGLALRNMIAALCSAVAALVAMAFDAGVYALVAQKFALITAMAVVTVRLDPWRPMCLFSPARARRLASKGLRLASGMLLHQLTPRLVDAVVGATLGAAALGYLRIAWQLSYFILNLFIYPVVSVASSAFAKIKDSPLEMRDTFRSMCLGALIMIAPAAFGLIAAAPTLIPALLGVQWIPSVTVIQLISITFFTEIPCYLLLGVLIGVGRANAFLAFGAFQFAASGFLAAVAAPFGVEAVAAAYVARCFLSCLFALHLLGQVFPLGAPALLKAATPPLLAGAVMAVAVAATQAVLDPGDGDRGAAAAILIGVGGVVYIGTLALGDALKLWRGFFRDILALARSLRPGR